MNFTLPRGKAKILAILIISLFPITAALSGQDNTLAVLYLETSPGGALKEEDKSALSLALTEMTISDLAALQMLTLVDRDNLNAIMEEQKLALTGLLDESTTAKAGELLGARFILTGKLLVAGNTATLSSRISTVETGEILASETRTASLDKVFLLREQVMEALILSWDIPLSRKERELLAERDSLSLEGLISFGNALDARDAGDLEKARAFLEKAVALNPDFTLASSHLEAIGERFDRYLTAREKDLPEEIIEKIDTLAQGNPQAENEFSKMYWAYLQPLMMGFSYYGMTQAMDDPYRRDYFNESVKTQWGQMGLTEEPEDMEELGKILGRKLYKAHGILEYLLEKDLPLEGYNAYLHPVEGAMGYFLTLFVYLSSTPDWQFPPMMDGEDTILSGEQFYPLLLRYCDMFLANFPYSSYSSMVTPLMQRLLELTETDS